MRLPEQDEFLIFAANDDEQASLKRKFLEKHKEPWLSESALEDYRAVYEYLRRLILTGKRELLACLRHFQIIRKGEKPVTVKFDYDSEIETAAAINLVWYAVCVHHYPMGSRGFDTELVRIEHILANSGYSLRVYQNSTFSDTCIVLYSFRQMKWKRVEQRYSPRHISAAYFVP